MFFYIKCVLFVLVLSISGEISAQEKRDSVRIYFHQGKVNIDTCLLDNGNEMERFAKICSALNDSVRLIRKIQIIGGASPEGGGLLNGRLSEKRAEVLWRYISKSGKTKSDTYQKRKAIFGAKTKSDENNKGDTRNSIAFIITLMMGYTFKSNFTFSSPANNCCVFPILFS